MTFQPNVDSDLFRLLVESVRDYAIFVLDPDGRVLTWNAGAERIKGYRADDILGRSFTLFYPKQDVAHGKPERALSLAARDGRYADEGWRVRKDGTRFWASVVLTALRDRDGSLVGFAKVTRDLTERHETELQAIEVARARAARERAEAEVLHLGLLADASEILASSLDYQTTLQNVARLAVPKLADWCAVDLIEGERLRRVAVHHRDPAKVRTARELQDRYPGDPEGDDIIAATIRTGEAMRLARVDDMLVRRHISDPEQQRLVLALELRSLIIAPLNGREGTLGALILACSESGRRYSEHDLILARELASRAATAIENARLVRAIARARDFAEQANETRDRFLATMSHELRTPLNAIAGHADLLQLGVHGGLEPAQLDAIERIKRNQRRLLRLIDDLLSLSRARNDRLDLRLETIPISAFLRRLERLLQRRIDEGEVVVDCDAVPADLVLRADPDRLEHIMLNILSSTLDPDGASRRVHISCEQDGRNVDIHVRHDGSLVASDRLDALFEPYAKAGPELAESTDGVDLSMAVSRDLARGMGGDLVASAAPDGGTVLTLSLPRTA